MVGVAQLVELRIVIPVVAGSIPVVHPIFVITRFPRSVLALSYPRRSITYLNQITHTLPKKGCVVSRACLF